MVLKISSVICGYLRLAEKAEFLKMAKILEIEDGRDGYIMSNKIVF